MHRANIIHIIITIAKVLYVLKKYLWCNKQPDLLCKGTFFKDYVQVHRTISRFYCSKLLVKSIASASACLGNNWPEPATYWFQ